MKESVLSFEEKNNTTLPITGKY